MPKVVTPAREAALTLVAKAATAYHGAEHVIRERHEQMIQSELLAIRTELAKAMVNALDIGTADTKIKDRSGIKDFYKRREMYELGRVASGATVDAAERAEVKRKAALEETPRFAMNEDGSFTMTILRKDFEHWFTITHSDGDSASAVFEVGEWGPYPAVEEARNPAYRAYVGDNNLKMEVHAWASQH